MRCDMNSESTCEKCKIVAECISTFCEKSTEELHEYWITHGCERQDPLHNSIFNSNVATEDRWLAWIAISFALLVRAAGWKPVQHEDAVIAVEEGSRPMAVVESPEWTELKIKGIEMLRSVAHQEPKAVKLPEFSSSTGMPDVQEEAFKIPWIDERRPKRLVRSFSKGNRDIWQGLVAEVASGWIRPPSHLSKVKASALLFAGPKGRLCFDMREAKELSQDRPVHFPYAADLLVDPEITCATKADVKSAYRLLGLDEDDAVYVAIVMDGIVLLWLRLPFGGKQCPKWFVQSLGASLARFHRQRAIMKLPVIRAVVMMDDLAVGGRTPLEALRNSLILLVFLAREGWVLSVKKCFLWPAVVLLFLGVLVDFELRTLRVFMPKVVKVATSIKEMLSLAALCEVDTTQWTMEPDSALMGTYKMVERWRSQAMNCGYPVCEVPNELSMTWTPEATEMVAALVDRVLGTASLSPKGAKQIEKTLGHLAWFGMVAPVINLWRRPLDEALKQRTWSVEAVRSLCWFLVILPKMGGWSFYRSLAEPVIAVLGDASGTGYGFVVPSENIWAADRFIEQRVQTEASGARESIPLIKALESLVEREISFRSVIYYTDSQVLAARAGKMSSRNQLSMQSFKALAIWVAAGVKISVHWMSREAEGMQVPDMLSSAVEEHGSVEWSLTPSIASSLWSATGGWDLDSFASESLRWAEEYCSYFPPTTMRGSRLAAFIDQGGGPASGYRGNAFSVSWENRSVLAFAPASCIPQAVEKFSTLNEGTMIIIFPKRPEAFWWPAIHRLRQWKGMTWDLGATESQCLVAPDGARPRWRRGEWLAMMIRRGVSHVVPNRLKPRWLVEHKQMVAADIETNPGPWGAKTKTQASKPAKWSISDLAKPKNISQGSSSHSAAMGGPASQGMIVAGPNIAGYSSSGVSSASHVAGHSSCGVSSEVAVAGAGVEQKDDATSISLLEWATSIGEMAETKEVPQGQEIQGLPPEVQEAAKEVHNDILASASSRSVGSWYRMLDFLIHKKWTELVYTKELAVMVVSSYLQCRYVAPLEHWPKVHDVGTLSNEASGMAASARRAGFDAPGYYGAREWLKSQGSSDKLLYSVKFPVFLIDILSWRPDGADMQKMQCWAALVIQALYHLRPGVIIALEREMIEETKGGYVLTWSRAMKTRRCQKHRNTLKTPQVSGARHPILTELFSSILPKDGLLFPSGSAKDIDEFFKSKLPLSKIPKGFKRGRHGIRVGTEIELAYMNVPKDVRNVFGWWSRDRSTAVYYGASNLVMQFEVTELLGRISYQPTSPGNYTATMPDGMLIPNWAEHESWRTYRQEKAKFEKKLARKSEDAELSASSSDSDGSESAPSSAEEETDEPAKRKPTPLVSHISSPSAAANFFKDPPPRRICSRVASMDQVGPRSRYESEEERKLHHWMLLSEADAQKVQDAADLAACPEEFRESLRRSQSSSN